MANKQEEKRKYRKRRTINNEEGKWRRDIQKGEKEK